MTHQKLYEKLVEHDGKISKMGNDIHGINEKLNPIAQGVTSMAWGFKALLWIGGLSAALVAILQLGEQLQ